MTHWFSILRESWSSNHLNTLYRGCQQMVMQRHAAFQICGTFAIAGYCTIPAIGDRNAKHCTGAANRLAWKVWLWGWSSPGVPDCGLRRVSAKCALPGAQVIVST